MSPKHKAAVFALLAPVTVPAYALFLAFANLLGGAFYIVIEASLARLVGKPISLSPRQMVLLALPVLLTAPVATAVHLVLWLLRLVVRFIAWIGRWQAATASWPASLAVGAAWLTVALWATVTCLNAAVGSAWIGRPVEGRDLYVEFMTRPRRLSDLPAEAQARRRQILEDLGTYREAIHPQWEIIRDNLLDDEVGFQWLRSEPLRRKLAGLPWFFLPAEFSQDGQDHSVLMPGALLFCWVLLIRWPGTHRILRFKALTVGWLAARLGVVAWAIYSIITWVPLTDYYGFMFGDDGPSWRFRALSLASWFGADYAYSFRPEWYLLNVAVWILLLLGLFLLWWVGWQTAPLVGWPRYYVSFLAARLLQRKRIAFFSVGAVTLCVAMMIIVISVMGGFVDSIRNRANGLLGDLVMDTSVANLQGFPYYQEFIDRISRLKDDNGEPLVVQATPLIYSYGILQFPNTKQTTAVKIVGVRLNEYVRVNEFGKDLFYNLRFGGTTLKAQRQPVYGFDERGLAVLPAEMEAHYRGFVDGLAPEERAEHETRYARVPGDPFVGPGVFKLAEDDRPGYEGPEFPGIIIGRSILFRRLPSGEFRRSHDYPRGQGCLLTVLPLTRGGDVSAEPPLKPPFRYADDSRTGIHEIDSMNVYVDFDTLQELLGMGPMELADGSGTSPPRCTQIQIKLRGNYGRDRPRLREKKELIWDEWDRFVQETPADGRDYAMMRDVGVQTWEEMQARYIAAIEKEKFLVLIMFGVISIVAVFLILCIFYMIVQEKTRDIGIIKSVGAGTEGVAAIFLAYGGGIGLVGCVLGTLLGTTFVEYINDIQDWLARLNPDWRVWSPETYSFDRIPDVWKWSEVLWISLLAVISSIVGATFPALRAGRTWPVESLRYE